MSKNYDSQHGHTATEKALPQIHDTASVQSAHPNNPLHGKTLQMILEYLVTEIGFARMGECVPINCFLKEPSIKSSLVFLRKTPWARTKVEGLYLDMISRNYK